MAGGRTFAGLRRLAPFFSHTAGCSCDRLISNSRISHLRW